MVMEEETKTKAQKAFCDNIVRWELASWLKTNFNYGDEWFWVNETSVFHSLKLIES